MRKVSLLASFTLAAIAASSVHAAAPTPAPLTVEKVSLPGEGRGDYVYADADARRLYVTHTGTVHILSLDTLRPLGEVTGIVKSAGVAFAAGKGFASDAGGNKIVVFEPATGKTIGLIQGEKKPDSILTDPVSGMVYVFNGQSDNVSVIDPKAERIVKTIDLGEGPEYSRTDGAGKIYVNLGESHSIGVIDTASQSLVRKIDIAGCEDPAALGIDTKNRRLFATCGNHVMKVVNADSGAVVASIPVGEDPDGVMYDARARRITVAARDGNWTIVDQLSPDSYRVNRTLKIDPYAKTLGFDATTGVLYSSTADLVWPKPTPGQRLLPDAASGTFRLMVISPK
ncbi:MAG: hypothetical protein JSR28_11155 [Proteobacteria bacterium]|nr:hypothetical protein [Pseudomonadota bacterium]